MDVPFLKMNGLGNDFVVIDARKHAVAMGPEAARAIGDRHRGVGFDQLLVIGQGKQGADAAMRIWNTDGTEVESCGNGTRCVATLILGETGKTRLSLWTKGGVLDCSREGDGRITVDMGEPKLEWQDIPLSERMDTRTLDIKLGPIDAPVLFGPSAVNMGNPHCIFFADNAEAHDLSKFGPMIEYHPLFPDRQLATLLLKDRGMSTSGSAVQFFRHQGQRYGHIIDPRTGWPVDAMLSVTVLAPDAAQAEALSTGFFVLGVEKAQEYCHNHKEVAALLVPAPATGNRLEPVICGIPESDLVFVPER